MLKFAQFCKHLTLEIFLTFSEVFWVFEAHFLIKMFLLKKTCNSLAISMALAAEITTYLRHSFQKFCVRFK